MSRLNSGIEILGIGSYVPELCVTNDDFAKIVDTTDEWITTRTGVKERRFCFDKSNGYMAAMAAQRAVLDAKASPEEIDLIIATTCTPDYLFPSVSCLVQREIKADNAACFDLNAACTGFVTALEVASAYFMSGKYKNILVVSSEKLSNQIDFSDRSTCVLFGDGAGAVLLKPSDGLFASHTRAVGEKIDDLMLCYKIIYNADNPFSDAEKPDSKIPNGIITMDGKSVYKFAVEAMPAAVNAVCEKAGKNVGDIDILIPHQANIRIIKTAVQSLGISPDKVYTNIELRGNTSSACIPCCLDELKKAGKLEKGMNLCFVGFGGGLTYGAVYLEY